MVKELEDVNGIFGSKMASLKNKEGVILKCLLGFYCNQGTAILVSFLK